MVSPMFVSFVGWLVGWFSGQLTKSTEWISMKLG